MSTRRDGSAVKRERMQQMHRMLRGGEPVELTRFLAACAYSIGLTERTARKYLEELESLDLVEVDEELGVVREVVKE